jgi:hypothetical protein
MIESFTGYSVLITSGQRFFLGHFQQLQKKEPWLVMMREGLGDSAEAAASHHHPRAQRRPSSGRVFLK